MYRCKTFSKALRVSFIPYRKLPALKEKMIKTDNYMACHVESSRKESSAYKYEMVPVALRISLKKGCKAGGAECGRR